MKQLLSQAFNLIRQNPFYSTISIIGTAVTIAFVMVVVMIYDFRTMDMAPESDRSDMMYTGTGITYLKLDHTNQNGGMGRKAFEVLFADIPGVKEVTWYRGVSKTPCNIFLGMLGTFWFRTRKNRSEIALRMAVGCSRVNVFGYYMLEGLLLLVLAAVPAILICLNMQMADLTVHTLMEPTFGRFLFCFALAMLLLGMIISLGIYFPARKAMQIVPADALHNE